MVSVVILGKWDPAPLAELLAQLVPAAVDGLVREVLLAGAAEGAALELCEEAGVALVRDRAAAEAAARSDWLLILPQGASLPDGWPKQAMERIGAGGGAIRETRLWRLARPRARVARRATGGVR